MDEHKDVCFTWKRKLPANIWRERAKPRANARSFKYISHFIKKNNFFPYNCIQELFRHKAEN